MSVVAYDELFDILDGDADGALSRPDLHQAAPRLGWHWQEAPLYALLDLLSLRTPLSRTVFIALMSEVVADPLGPFGQVLRRSHPLVSLAATPNQRSSERPSGSLGTAAAPEEEAPAGLVTLLKRTINTQAGEDYAACLRSLPDPHPRLDRGAAGLLILDPQRAFTCGTWMQSIGPDGPAEVQPILIAFDNCARLWRECYRNLEIVFTRCPFPPASYAWDERLAEVLDLNQAYFIKPGNSVLWPPTNGFQEWVESLLERGKRTLVMGGCTLNSCVRISSIETQHQFRDRGLQVLVDLSLSAARKSNYLRSALFGGISSVESAVREMRDAGVQVVQRVSWQ